ncbi:MAG: hypothetical protein IJR91_06055, partial [Ruminococcus sp.]|nr:hypothetical protein [Ruminococcus sp.]
LLDVAQSEAHFARKPASNLGNLTKICASTPVEAAHTDAQGSCGVALKSFEVKRTSAVSFRPFTFFGRAFFLMRAISSSHTVAAAKLLLFTETTVSQAGCHPFCPQLYSCKYTPYQHLKRPSDLCSSTNQRLLFQKALLFS